MQNAEKKFRQSDFSDFWVFAFLDAPRRCEPKNIKKSATTYLELGIF